MADERITGRIIKLHPRGWGFISSNAKPFTRIFFHWAALNPKINFSTLRKGMVVSFICADYKDQGLRALRIELEK